MNLVLNFNSCSKEFSTCRYPGGIFEFDQATMTILICCKDQFNRRLSYNVPPCLCKNQCKDVYIHINLRTIVNH